MMEVGILDATEPDDLGHLSPFVARQDCSFAPLLIVFVNDASSTRNGFVQQAFETNRISGSSLIRLSIFAHDRAERHMQQLQI